MSFTPDYAIHPGVSLAEALDDASMTQGDLARRTGLTEKHINNIIHGKAPVTPSTAIMLQSVLGISMGFWNNLQKNYDETIARLADEERIQEEVGLLPTFRTCYNELVHHDIIQRTTRKVDQYKQLVEYFGITSLLHIDHSTTIAYRKHQNATCDAPTLAAWIKHGDKQAQDQVLPEYNEKLLKNMLPRLRNLVQLHNGFGKEIQNLLQECGVYIVFSPYFSHTYVNGATRRIHGKPLIQISMRGKSHDGLRFTLFHEIGHVLLHGKKDQFIEYEHGDTYQNDPKEKEANMYAADILIPPEKYTQFIARGDLSFEAIRQFSQEIDTDPGIVAGRLAKEGHISYPVANKYRKQIMLSK